MRSILVTLAAVVALLVPAASAPAGAWERPVEGPVLRPFAVGPDRFAAGQHRGIDLGAPPGIRVLAACGGRVTFAGRVPRGGRTVSVRCGPLVATYQHLGAVAVRRGQIVLPGARIGRVGHARPRPHVHLGARDAATGAYVDPLGLFAGAPHVVPPPVAVQRRPLPLGPAPAAVQRRPLPLGPPPVAVQRRPLPLGPPPVAVQRRPLPLGPAPAARRPRARPSALPTAHPAAIPPRAGAYRLPWPVWLGLALVALGLPLGGALTVRRRRQAPPPVPQTAS